MPFEAWRARAAYYFDPVGNLVELIARERAPGDRAADGGERGRRCRSRTWAPRWTSSRRSSGCRTSAGTASNFSAVGDDHGLFIVVPVGRAWLFTDRPAARRPGARDDRGRGARASCASPGPSTRHRGSLQLTMVDWSLARQVARLAAGAGDEGPPQADVAALCAEMEEPRGAPTRGCRRPRPCRAPELVSRADWASVNLDSLATAARPGRRAAGRAARVRGPAGRRPARPARRRRWPPRPGS